MAQLTAAQRLAKIKTALGFSGTFQDDALSIYIDDVIDELICGGVQKEVAESTAAVGCIAVGVNDLWNYSSGGVKHSDAFYKRLIQLSKCKLDVIEPTKSIEIFVPSEEDSSVFGWTVSSTGINKVFMSEQFTVTDGEVLKACIVYADGTTFEAENTSTGNRRNLSYGSGKYILVMPETIYDTANSKYINNEGTTTILVKDAALYSGKIMLNTYVKG